MARYTAGGRLAAVIGYPVGHSKSPLLHGHWLDRYGIDGAYLALSVAPNRLDRVVPALADCGFRGFNVTIPHKEAILPLLSRVDDRARRIGAVNTVVIGTDGALVGSNTDGYGFLENLRAGAPDLGLAGQAVVVLGAGGAVRSVLVALIEAGAVPIRVINRSQERLAALARDLPEITPLPWSDLPTALGDCALLVNGTSLGMTGAEPLAVDLSPLPATAVVTDMVYAPLDTDLLVQARRRGLKTVDGLGMLLHQARPGFEAWFGVTPMVDAALRDAVLTP